MATRPHASLSRDEPARDDDGAIRKTIPDPGHILECGLQRGTILERRRKYERHYGERVSFGDVSGAWADGAIHRDRDGHDEHGCELGSGRSAGRECDSRNDYGGRIVYRTVCIAKSIHRGGNGGFASEHDKDGNRPRRGVSIQHKSKRAELAGLAGDLWRKR